MRNGREKLEKLQNHLESNLIQLEAQPWEIEHILHLHGQKCCSVVSKEIEPDESVADEFINAYLNEEKWVTHIPYETYAEKLIEESIKFFEEKSIPPLKRLYLHLVKPLIWLEGSAKAENK